MIAFPVPKVYQQFRDVWARDRESLLGVFDTNMKAALESMQNRTEIVSGRFLLESNPGEGTRIECFWPFH